MHSLLVWVTALGLMNHLFSNRYEPSSANIPFIFLAFQPALLLVFIREHFSSPQIFWSYFIFLVSRTRHRQDNKIMEFVERSQGYKYLYYKKLYNAYGLSWAMAASRKGGITKLGDTVLLRLPLPVAPERHMQRSAKYGIAQQPPPPFVNMTCWSQNTLANWSLVCKTLVQLTWSASLTNFPGRDVDGVGEQINGFLNFAEYTGAADLAGHIPWIIDTLHLFPQAGWAIQEFNSFGQDLARQRMKNGVAGPKDLWYYIADEAGLEKEEIV
ncbi:hypothetical protein DFH08DRAFT_816566 [Mycena albidolilacea]|uniref:Uncharacterized protein n=1 Tax=Mycena albidolilacea TaxID=1033008 RepID=A0AAD6ZJW3_9AGAR|nr:hypothetical protein DFH08DRAFT_816566 [Mycena albidolilacea]